jgi:hypothetical protein
MYLSGLDCSSTPLSNISYVRVAVILSDSYPFSNIHILSLYYTSAPRFLMCHPHSLSISFFSPALVIFLHFLPSIYFFSPSIFLFSLSLSLSLTHTHTHKHTHTHTHTLGLILYISSPETQLSVHCLHIFLMMI